MTDTLISLISIFVGIIGANMTGFLFIRHSLGLTGNTIAGVFGSIFFIKSLGHLGFDPIYIMESGSTNFLRLSTNLMISFLGGAVAIVIAKRMKQKMNKPDTFTFFGTKKLPILGLFKVISILEGLSYILLLFIGMPLKYLGQNEILVKSLGMPHGLLFMAYVVIALLLRSMINWNHKTFFIVLIAAVLPFGTFYIHKKYLRHKD